MAPPTGPSKGHKEEKRKKSPTRKQPTTTQARRTPTAPGTSSATQPASRADMPPPRKSAGGRDDARTTQKSAQPASSRDSRAQPSAAAETTATAGQRTRRPASSVQPAQLEAASAAIQARLQPPQLAQQQRPPSTLSLQPSGSEASIPDSPLSPDATTSTGDQSLQARIERESRIIDGLRRSGASEEILAAREEYFAKLVEQLEQDRPAAHIATSGPDASDESAAALMPRRDESLSQWQPRATTARSYAAVITTAPASLASSSSSLNMFATMKTTTATSSSGTANAAPAPSTSDAAPASQPPPEEKKKARYPPIVVEKLQNWTTHFKALKEAIGRAPNARPLGNGVRFTPTDEDEYRIVQRYMEEMEPPVPWFSYTLPKEKEIKLAIRGLPADTSPEEIKGDLQDKGFGVDYVRRIRARRGRPGCIFFAICQRNRETVPAIYNTEEILCMPGVKIDSWRGKRGPAQCHRCQQFRHSSHGCHRRQACVRCGGEHMAHQCPRPLAEPATCANCQGPHPANSKNCPILRNETKNKKAGTVAITSRPVAPQPKNVEEHAAATLMAPANLPKSLSKQDSSKEKKKKKKKKKKQSAPATREATTSAPAPATQKKTPAAPQQRPARSAPRTQPSEEKIHITEIAVKTLQEVLNALRSGEDAVPVILRGISNILEVTYG